MTVHTAFDRPRRDVWILDAGEQPEAAEQYRQSCAHLFDIEILDDDAAFYNQLQGYNLPGAVFGKCRGVAQRFTRDQSHIRTQGPRSGDAVQVILAQSGRWSGDYDGRAADGAMGAIRLVDMSRPFNATTTAFESLNLMIPRSALGQAAEVDFHGIVVPDSSAGGRLLAAQMTTLFDLADQLSTVEAAAAVQVLSALVAGVIITHGISAGPRPAAADRTLLSAARSYIDANLGSEVLTPGELHRHLGVSRTRLYALFSPGGGVAKFIQTRRLDRAFDAITESGSAHLSLAQIAYAHGFRSDAHFNRAFRARFGIRPGRLRGLGRRAEPPVAGSTDLDRVFSWIDRL